MTPKAQTTEKVDSTSKLKTCASKYTINTINRVKGQPMEWEKLFTNPISDKGIISRIYKHFYNKKSWKKK